MSTNCPPQLQLSIDIQPSTTSFKRSFEQFGFDLDSPVITGPEDLVAEGAELDTAAMDGNVEGRSTGIGMQQQNGSRRGNKRPRSASSFSSESSSSASASTSSGRRSEASSASTSLSASSTSSPPSVHHPSSIRPQNRTRIQLLSPSPPRLPTPEIQDIEMPAEYSTTTESVIGDHHQHHSNPALLAIPIPTTTHALSTSFVPQVHHPQPHAASSSSPPPQQQSTTEDMFRLSLERFNAFDTEISALRQTDNPPSLSLSLGLGLMPTTGGIRATTTRMISPTPLSADHRQSRTPPPTLPLLPIQVEADRENESAMILPEVLPTATITTAPISASASSSSSSSHINRGSASTAASNNATTNTLDFHVPTSPFADHFFMQEGFVERSGEEEEGQELRTNAIPAGEEEEDEEEEEIMFEDDEEQSSFRFREHLQDHLRDRRHPRMPFHDRLDRALARLRSRSPLVPGIGDGGSSSSEASGERESEESGEERRGRRNSGRVEDHWEDAIEPEDDDDEEEEEPSETRRRPTTDITTYPDNRGCVDICPRSAGRGILPKSYFSGR